MLNKGIGTHQQSMDEEAIEAVHLNSNSSHEIILEGGGQQEATIEKRKSNTNISSRINKGTVSQPGPRKRRLTIGYDDPFTEIFLKKLKEQDPELTMEEPEMTAQD